MTLDILEQFGRSHVFNGSLVNDAFRDEVLCDEFAEPRGSFGIVLIVVVHEWKQAAPPFPARNADMKQRGR